MELTKAKIKTESMKLADVFKMYEGNLEQDYAERLLKGFHDLDGCIVNVIDGLDKDSRLIVGWDGASDETIKSFIYLLEQDSMFGTYEDDWEEFSADWDSSQYEPAGAWSFPLENLEILEVQ